MISRHTVVSGLWVLLVAGSLTTGCKDFERFDNGDGSAFCGKVIGATFVRQGFEHRPRLQLQLDTDQLHRWPGRITTDDAADGPCSPLATFNGAQLRSSEKLQSDPLSVLSFGEERDHNFISWVDSSCDGTYLVVTSLMRDDSVEVRLMRSEKATESNDEVGPFGVFQLKRFDGDCGFE
ncbi:MAG: hypothetical protein RJA70_1048 [Pseudomonadota bacterium]|jgi:hypothetical protein